MTLEVRPRVLHWRCQVRTGTEKQLRGKESILLRQAVPMCSLPTAASSKGTNEGIFTQWSTKRDHADKSSNQVAQMFWSLSAISNCLEMCLSFLDLALGLSCESSQNSKSQSPNPLYSYSVGFWSTQLSLTEFARKKVATRFEVAGERGLRMKWWNFASFSEESVLSLAYLCVFLLLLFFVFLFFFFTSQVGCILRGNINTCQWDSATLLSAEFLLSLREELFPVGRDLSEEAVLWDLDGSSSQQGFII